MTVFWECTRISPTDNALKFNFWKSIGGLNKTVSPSDAFFCTTQPIAFDFSRKIP